MSANTDLTTAALLAFAISLLVAVINIPTQSKASLDACVKSWPFAFYAAILALGNMVATLLASIPVQQKLGTSLQPASPFLAAFFGVFAFQGVLSNTNVTLFGKGVLTIDDWITRAADSAVGAAVANQVRADGQKIISYTEKLMQLPEPELNAHILEAMGAKTVAELEADALASKADPRFYKALAFASNHSKKAAAICDRRR